MQWPSGSMCASNAGQALSADLTVSKARTSFVQRRVQPITGGCMRTNKKLSAQNVPDTVKGTASQLERAHAANVV
jgi:hypothetical protein